MLSFIIRFILTPVRPRWLLFWFCWEMVHRTTCYHPQCYYPGLLQMSLIWSCCLIQAITVYPQTQLSDQSFKNLSCPFSSLLQTLQWPLISFRINVKILTMAYKALLVIVWKLFLTSPFISLPHSLFSWTSLLPAPWTKSQEGIFCIKSFIMAILSAGKTLQISA